MLRPLEEIARLIDSWIRQEKLKLEDYLFHKFSYRLIQKRIKIHAKKAGIEKNVMMHSFRHYFVTSLMKQGWSHDQVQKVLGLASITTVQTYDASSSLDMQDKARDAMKEL